MVLTHDRRVRVFVSSTLNEAAEERQAARAAIESLHLTPVMFDLGARPYPPQQLYRSYLEQSDIFVGIYLEQYGWVGPGASVSGLEDELQLSGDRPKLVYLKAPAPQRDARLTAMIEQIWAEAGTSTSNYADAAQLQRLIADDLAVLLSERFSAFATPGPGSHEGFVPTRPPVPGTDLLGRGEPVRTGGALLLDPAVRLITITGPGGVGKTRLALELLIGARQRFPTIAFVDLAAVTDADQVPAAVATALGVLTPGARDPLDVVADRVGAHPVLLLLDNVEHVLAAAPAVGRLLEQASGLVVLATGRTGLRLRAEHEVTLQPLDLPGPGAATRAEVLTSTAAQLFEQRARKARAQFAVDDASAATVAQLVHRLDGIPLAIELAAARCRLLPPSALLHHLGDTLDLRAAAVDVPDRQFTLRSTIAWSFALLSDGEREVLEQLSVFPGDWSLAGAEAVVEPPPGTDLLEALSELIQQSLLVPVEDDSGTRFRIFQSVRAYAAEQLGEAPRRACMLRLAGYLCELGRIATQQAGAPPGRAARAELDADLDAVRATFDWAVAAGDAQLAVQLGSSLARYLWSRAMLADLADLVERTASMPAAADLPPASLAELTWGRGSIALAVGRFEDARQLLEHALEIAESTDHEGRLLAHARFSLAVALPYASQAPRMQALLEQAMSWFRARQDAWGESVCLIPLGEIALRAGDLGTARALHEQALGAAETIEDDHLIGQCLNQLAVDALLHGEADAARDLLLRAADSYRWLPDQEGLAYCLDGFAGLLLTQGDPVGAARLLGCAARVRAVTGIAVWPLMQPLAEQFASAVQAGAGAEYETAWAAGQATPALTALDDAIAATRPAD